MISSKKKAVRKDAITFSDGTKIKMHPSSAGSIRQKPGRGIHRIPEEKQITELPQEKVEERDEYDDLPYPPPSKNKVFREVWAKGIENITSRDNFDESHLTLFETYCYCLVNLRRLDEFISDNGQTYRITTVTGEIRRTHPEVGERNKTIGQIAQYAKLLDLLPGKNKSKKVKKEEAEDWA